MGREITINATVVENPIKSIEYTLPEPVKFTEGVDCWEDQNEYGEVFFHYSENSIIRKGAILTLKKGEDESINYVYTELDEDYYAFVNENDSEDLIDSDDLRCSSDQSYDNQWQIGKHEINVNYQGLSTSVTVEVVENPIKSIEYTPVEPVELTEGVECWEDEDETGEKYFRYYESSIYQEGAILTLKTGDGESINYVYTYYDDDHYFINENDSEDRIFFDDLTLTSDQGDDNHWLPGDHEVILTYHGRSTTVPVKIVETPVESISFSPDTIELIDHLDGDMDWDYDYDADDEIVYFRYDCDNKIYTEGSVLTVNYKNGEQKTFKCSPDERKFVNTEDDSESVDLYCSAHQSGFNPWEVNNTYDVDVVCMGVRTTIQAKIVENPLSSIEYKPASPIELIELTDGKIEYYGDSEEEYFRYDGDIFQDGAELVLTKNGDEIHYVFTPADDYHPDPCFVNTKDREDIINLWDLDVRSDQGHDNQWEPGEHEFIIYYEGKTASVPVEVVPTPVESISFSPENIELVENRDGNNEYGYFQYYCDGQIDSEESVLTLTYKNGEVKTYKADSDGMKFVNIEDETDKVDLIYYTDQSEWNQWEAGNTYDVLLSCMGQTTTIQAKIVENPIQDIAYELAEPIELVEGRDNDEDNYYSVSGIFQEGAKLILKTEDGDISYVYKNDDDYNWCFVNENDDNDVIEYYELDVSSDQSDENIWQPGEHEIIITYQGKSTSVPVSVVENPVESISFSPDTIELVDKVDGETTVETDDDDNEFEYFKYDCLSQIESEDSVLTVKYKNGDERTYKYDSDEGCFVNTDDREDYVDLYCDDDQSYDNQWVLDGLYDVELTCMGVTTTIQAKIVENPIQAFEYKVTPPIELIEGVDGEEVDTDSGDIYFYYDEYCIFREGAEFTLKTKDNELRYVFMDDDEGQYFVNAEDATDVIGCRELEPDSDQSYENQWMPENTYEVNVTYKGISASVPVKIIKNPVEKISFSPEKIELVDHVDGETFWDDDDEPEYFLYRPERQIESKDSVLTLTYNNGEVKTYKYDSEYEMFVNISDSKDRVDYSCITDQSYTNQWEVGKTYDFTLECMGKETTVKAEIVKNPVVSIAFEPPTTPVELLEHNDDYGFWEYDWDDDGNKYDYFYYDTDRILLDKTKLSVTTSEETKV